MSKYELIYIIDRDLTEDKREELIAKLKSYVEERKSEIIALDKWGMKKLAYPINYKHEGYYVFMTFSTQDNNLVGEMSKYLNITENVVRHMFVKKEN